MNYKEAIKNITTFIFDVDGVLTDGTLSLSSSGELVRTMNTRDGYALQLAIKKGYNICIITGGSSQMVKKRLEGLGIKDIYLKIHYKIEIMDDYLAGLGLSNREVLYMGDDMPDYECIKNAGIGSCPQDAAHQIREISDYVSTYKGGEGCVRDVIEQTLKLHNKWE